MHNTIDQQHPPRTAILIVVIGKTVRGRFFFHVILDGFRFIMVATRPSQSSSSVEPPRVMSVALVTRRRQ